MAVLTHKIPLRKSVSSKTSDPEEIIDRYVKRALQKYALYNYDPVYRLDQLTLSFPRCPPVETLRNIGHDVGYFGEAHLGEQAFLFMFDTGSSDLWVPASDSGFEKHATFDSSKSSFFKTFNKPFSITYGKGKTSGIIASDTFSLAGLKIPQQTFGLSFEISPDLIRAPFDGICGMGFDELSAQGAQTPVHNLINLKELASPVFSFRLGREKDGTGGDSEMLLGGIIGETNQDHITFYPVIKGRGFWEIPFEGVSIGGRHLLFRNRTAIVDTGTSLILAPTRDAMTIYKAIPGAQLKKGNYFLPSAGIPDIALIFKGEEFPISPLDLFFGGEAGGGLVLSGIQAGDMKGKNGTWLIGDVFLKNVISVFDFGQRAVGFVPLGQN